MTSEMKEKEDGTSMECGGEKMDTEACRNISDDTRVPLEQCNLRIPKNIPETKQPQASQVVQQGIYPCSTCGREFACPKAMHGHMRIHSKGKDVKDNEEDDPPEDEEETNNEEEEEPSENEDTGDGDGKRDPPTFDTDATFFKGEKVLILDGLRIYDDKVQEVEFGNEEWRYFIHYIGWNKNWDEWLGADRLLKYTDENVQKQKALQKQIAGEKAIAKSGRSSRSKAKTTKALRGKKTSKTTKALSGKKTSKGQSGTEEKEKIVPIQLPSTLRKQLVDEWEFVNKLGKLVRLPRSPNVDDILKKYLDYRRRKDGEVAADTVGEILKGIRCYFDKALPARLLYRKERHQFHQVTEDGASPSAVYGAEHLLRLFVKLPELLAYVGMEEEAHAKLQQNLLDFLKFLQMHQSTFFLSTYDG